MDVNEVAPESRQRKPQLTIDEKCEILLMKKDGIPVKEIAQHFQRGIQTIRDVLNKWREEKTVKRKVGTGFVRKTSAEQDTQLIQFAKLRRFHTNQQIINALELNISRTT
ncbi:hypothetical protein B4U80_14639, partial [Leptotrombidium deliense]